MNDTLRIPLMISLLLVCQTRLIDRVRLTIVSEKEKTKSKRESLRTEGSSFSRRGIKYTFPKTNEWNLKYFRFEG